MQIIERTAARPSAPTATSMPPAVSGLADGLAERLADGLAERLAGGRFARLTDASVLLQATGGNKEAFRQMLSVFLQIFPDMVERLQQVFAARNFTCLVQSVHSVKGCLFLIGAIGSAERMERIESIERGKTVLCGDIEFEKLMQELRLVIEEIKNELELAALPPERALTLMTNVKNLVPEAGVCRD